MKAEIEKSKTKKRKKDVNLQALQIEAPTEALELISSTVILDIDTTLPDKVIVNLDQGVDIVKPGDPSSVVLLEKVYRIRKSPRKLASPSVKNE